MSTSRTDRRPGTPTAWALAAAGVHVAATGGAGAWLWIVLLAVLVVAAAAIVAVARAQRRHRRQVEVLLERLADLEARRGGTFGAESAADSGIARSADETGSVDESGSVAPTADVLAGRTTYVQRMVEGPGPEAESLADQAVVCVHRHLEDNVTPGQIADELFVSLRTLERGLSVSLGCTPSQLILAMKMREAKRLLRSGSYRVNEVASKLGFSSPSHFSIRFKRFYRKAPSEFIPSKAA